jgi:hypothetical protein
MYGIGKIGYILKYHYMYTLTVISITINSSKVGKVKQNYQNNEICRRKRKISYHGDIRLYTGTGHPLHYGQRFLILSSLHKTHRYVMQLHDMKGNDI